MIIDKLPEHRMKEYYIKLVQILNDGKKKRDTKKLKELDIEFNSGIHPIDEYLEKESKPKRGRPTIVGTSIYKQHGFKDKEDVERYIKKSKKLNDKKQQKMLKKIDWYFE